MDKGTPDTEQTGRDMARELIGNGVSVPTLQALAVLIETTGEFKNRNVVAGFVAEVNDYVSTS